MKLAKNVTKRRNIQNQSRKIKRKNVKRKWANKNKLKCTDKIELEKKNELKSLYACIFLYYSKHFSSCFLFWFDRFDLFSQFDAIVLKCFLQNPFQRNKRKWELWRCFEVEQNKKKTVSATDKTEAVVVVDAGFKFQIHPSGR